MTRTQMGFLMQVEDMVVRIKDSLDVINETLAVLAKTLESKEKIKDDK